MNKSLVYDYRTMGKNAAVLTVVCLMLCLSFNYTFPLHRETTHSSLSDNHSQQSGHEKQEHTDGIVDRTKQIASNIELALKKFIDLAPLKDNTKNESKCTHAKHAVIDSDLSNYEQLVIMKKYPYLDLQQLDFSYRSSPNKIAGPSENSAPNLAQDPISFCESSDEGPNVEITNRGLSGFALPTKLIKTDNIAEVKTNMNNSQNVITQTKITSSATTQPPDDIRLLENLEEDIKKFEKHIMGS